MDDYMRLASTVRSRLGDTERDARCSDFFREVETILKSEMEKENLELRKSGTQSFTPIRGSFGSGNVQFDFLLTVATKREVLISFSSATIAQGPGIVAEDPSIQAEFFNRFQSTQLRYVLRDNGSSIKAHKIAGRGSDQDTDSSPIEIAKAIVSGVKKDSFD